MKLTDHEQKILDLVRKNPEIVTDSKARNAVAKKHGLTEKTLRNRIADLKKYGYIVGTEPSKSLPDQLSEKGLVGVSRDGEDSSVRPVWQLIKTLYRHKWNLFAFNTLVAITTVAILLLLPKWYRSTTTFIVKTEKKESITDVVSGAFDLGGLMPSQTEQAAKFIAYLESRRIQDKIIDEFDLFRVYEAKFRDDVYEALLANCSFVDNENGTISIHCMYKENPIKASQMANSFYNHLFDLALELERNNAIIYRDYIQFNHTIAVDSLRNLEEYFMEFQSIHGVYSIEEQVKLSVENLASMELEKVKMEIEFDYLSSLYDDTRPELKNLGVKLNKVRNKIEQMKTDEEFTQLPTSNIPDKGMQFLRFYRAVLIQEKIVEFLTLRLEQAKLEERKTTANIFLLDTAVPADKKAWPPRTVYLIVTMFFSSVLSILFYRIKDVIQRDSHEIRKHLTS